MNNVSIPKIIPFNQKQWLDTYKLWLNPLFKNKSYLTMVNDLIFKKADMTDLSAKRHFISFDTETYNSNGNMICLCNSQNDKVLYGTPTFQPTIDDYYKYFFNLSKTNKKTIIGAWNLKFDAMIILKTIPHDIMEQFFYGIDNERYVFKFENGLKISYLPKKALSLTKNGKTVILYDFMQFFGGSLEKNAIKYKSFLEKKGIYGSKEYSGKYQDKNFPDQIEKDELDEIVKYCKKDSKLTSKLMEIWVDAFFKNFGFYPDRYYSAGYLSKKYLTTQFDSFPTFEKIPYAVNALAYNSYWGGRFEIMKKGKLKDIHHVDINSAYPFAMSQIPDFSEGKWRKVNMKTFNYDCSAGFYKVKVKVFEENVCPFPFRDMNGQVFFPNGEFTTFITHHELKSAFQGGYKFDLLKLEGFEFLPTVKSKKSQFNELIVGMYDKRLKMRKVDESQSTVYKVLVNSLYGKFAQSKPKPKGLFNPIFASYITGKCRSMLLDTVKDNKNDVIMFATDGIFTSVPLNVKISKEKILGEYDYVFHPNFLLIMAGIYSYNTLKDLSLKTQSRGFSLRTFVNEKDIKPTTFNLNEYQLNRIGEKYFYEFWNVRPIAISEAVIQHKFNSSMIGKFRKIKKEIDLNGDKKRIWNGLLKNLEQTIDSKPARIGLI